jgi:hypothetical protein
MFIQFSALSPSSKIWIYQSDKKFTTGNKVFIQTFLQNYCEGWKAHGEPLRASFDLRFNHFIIIAADESFNTTSGCSVDDSVRAIKEVEVQTGLSFFNRNLIGFLAADDVFLLELPKLKEKYGNGIWNETTLTFNNLIGTKIQLENEWIVPAGNTWLKRYVPTETVKT